MKNSLFIQYAPMSLMCLTVGRLPQISLLLNGTLAFFPEFINYRCYNVLNSEFPENNIMTSAV